MRNNIDKKPFIVYLEGDLGSGKTSLIQGMASELGIKRNITSPTFNIIKQYNFDDRIFYHVDLYRVGKYDIENVLKSDGIICVEWPNKELPDPDILIKMEYIDKNKRKIWIKEY